MKTIPWDSSNGRTGLFLIDIRKKKKKKIFHTSKYCDALLINQ